MIIEKNNNLVAITKGAEGKQKDRIQGAWSYEPVGRGEEDGSWGWEKEGMSPSISTTSSPFFFLFNTFFHHQQVISNPQCARACLHACVCVCLSVCWRWGLGPRPLKLC